MIVRSAASTSALGSTNLCFGNLEHMIVLRKTGYSMMKQKGYGRLFIGTSGWNYADWRGRLYPKELPSKDWLPWYGEQFAATEINTSFYRTPTVEAVQAWRDRT